jgi:pyruvate dehydrogenase (quinone)
MRAMEGAPAFTESQTLSDVPYAFADFLGLQGIAVNVPDDVGPAWERALAADRPTLPDWLRTATPQTGTGAKLVRLLKL